MNIKMIAGCALLASVTTTFYLYSGAAVASAAAMPATTSAGTAAAAPMAGLQGRGQGVLRFWGLAIYEARLWVSPGVAVFQGDVAEALPTLIERADQALYASKREGKGRATLAQPPDRHGCSTPPLRNQPPS